MLRASCLLLEIGENEKITGGSALAAQARCPGFDSQLCRLFHFPLFSPPNN